MDLLLRCIQLFLICYFNSRIISSSEVRRPRGVSLAQAPLYRPDHDFICLDGSKTIPFSYVNDDYCDCPDSSDEPGTSACTHGKFFCTNAGYESMLIGSDRVNDGICDCCDGSDEYSSSSTCENNCLELDRYAKEEAIEREKILKAGKELYEEYCKQGNNEKELKKAKLLELEKHKEEAGIFLLEKEQLKFEAEIRENHALEQWKIQHPQEDEGVQQSEVLATFVKYDANNDGKVTYGELQKDLIFDKDNDGEVSHEEALYFLNGHDEVAVETFASEAWRLIKPYLKSEDEEFEEKSDGDEDEINKEEENVEDNDGGDAENEESESKPQDTEQNEQLVNSGYDEETQKIIDAASDARKEFSDAESSVKNIDMEIKHINEYLNYDFGINQEFAPLLGQCFEYVDHEYIYKLCPFAKTVQQPKSGGHETLLGSWGKWSGPESNKFQGMLFEGGQTCWNGPQRSTLVNLSCGSENKVTSVFEPNRCEYVFSFVTPASCSDAISNENQKGHDEL